MPTAECVRKIAAQSVTSSDDTDVDAVKRQQSTQRQQQQSSRIWILSAGDEEEEESGFRWQDMLQ